MVDYRLVDRRFTQPAHKPNCRAYSHSYEPLRPTVPMVNRRCAVLALGRLHCCVQPLSALWLSNRQHHGMDIA